MHPCVLAKQSDRQQPRQQFDLQCSQLRNYIAGLQGLHEKLQDMPASLLKMDVQNVIYRYFAESARLFKKIQHSIRSGEAELSVVCDGEEPTAEDLAAAFEKFVEAINAFSCWTKADRAAAGNGLKSRFDKETPDELKTAAGGAVVAAAGTGALAATTAGLGYAVLVSLSTAVLSGGGMLLYQGESCAGPRKGPRDGVMSSWQDTGRAEEDILSFLSCCPVWFHEMSFPLALQRTRDLRGELDRFLQLLQMEFLIFDPAVHPSASDAI